MAGEKTDGNRVPLPFTRSSFPYSNRNFVSAACDEPSDGDRDR
jgi:hypothetical protein